MLDIIGFWGVVTSIVGILLLPILTWVFPQLITHFLAQVMGSYTAATRVTFKIVQWNYSTVSIFRAELPEWFVLGVNILGSFMWFLVGLATVIPCEGTTEPPFESYVDFIAQTGVLLGPSFGGIFLCILGYFISIVLLRRAYKAYTKIEKVIAKLDENS